MGAQLKGRTRRAHGVMSDINVTPLVDVMLVLLVIFMITAPLLTTGVQVNLPKAQANAISQQDNKPIEISLDAKGRIYIGEKKVTVDQLGGVLQAIAQETTDRRVYIRADNDIDYGKVVSVMATVNSAGFSKIALVTDSTKNKKD
ncbi:MAG: protein TolR [Alphaproteobacteria bacterium]|nr:protein TolR [Alphaproteobacteria bacterium]